ncbi:MAG: YlmC/YmxH family sporulation protein [Oscillospiraceae bacterium]
MEGTARVFDLGCKEVINLATGQRLGYVRDAEIDTATGTVTALIIPGKLRFFGLLGRDKEKIIPWNSIEKLGDDIIFIKNVPIS